MGKINIYEYLFILNLRGTMNNYNSFKNYWWSDRIYVDVKWLISLGFNGKIFKIKIKNWFVVIFMFKVLNI